MFWAGGVDDGYFGGKAGGRRFDSCRGYLWPRSSVVEAPNVPLLLVPRPSKLNTKNGSTEMMARLNLKNIFGPRTHEAGPSNRIIANPERHRSGLAPLLW